MRTLTIILILLISAFPAHSQTIRIGYFQLAPYVFKDDNTGKIRGATYDFIKKDIEPLMKVSFKWSKDPIPISRLVKLLEMGDIDACAVFAKNKKRERIFVYPKEAYFTSHPTLVITKDRKLNKITSAKDLYNLTIGYCSKSYISPFMRDKKIKWDLLFSSTCIEQNFRRVVARRIDAQYQPSGVEILYYAGFYGVEKDIKLVMLPEKVDLFIPFSKKAAKKYINSFNSAMEKSGGMETFMKHLAKYIDISKL